MQKTPTPPRAAPFQDLSNINSSEYNVSLEVLGIMNYSPKEHIKTIFLISYIETVL